MRRWMTGTITILSLAGCALAPEAPSPSMGEAIAQPTPTLPVVERYARCLLAKSPPAEGCKDFPQDKNPLALSHAVQRRAEEAMTVIYGTEPSESRAQMAGRYLIRLHADADSCFPDLNTPQRLGALLDQVDQIAAFLSDYHARVLGVPSASVLAPTVIEICSTRLGPGPLYWSGPNTMQIRMPSDPVFGDSSKGLLVSYGRIAQAWHSGEQHVEELRLFSRPVDLRRIWPVLDPAGTIRVGLRKQIVHRSEELQTRIRGLQQELNRMAAGGVPPDRLRAAAVDLVAAETGLPREQVEQDLRHWEVADALRAWQAAAADPQTLASIAEELGAAIRPCGSRRDTEETKRLYGLVVIDNMHDIYICVGAWENGEQDRPAGEGRALRRDITAVGLLVVSTGDVVHLEASLQDKIHGLLERSRSVARTSFLRAMNRMDRGAF